MKLSARTWTAAGVAAGLLVAGFLVYVGVDDEAGVLWRDASVELRPLPALKGVRLGEPFEEVTARLGPFDLDPQATRPEVAGERSYVQRGGGPLRLLVREGRVARISYACRNADPTRVNRIACGDREPRVIEVFGAGARRLCAKVAASSPEASTAPHAFALDVPDTGTRHVVLYGHVSGFILMGRDELDNALGGDSIWHRCPS